MDKKQLENNFTYHAPDFKKVATHEAIRSDAYAFAQFLNELPESREKALALTKLEECVMWANACVARY